MVSLVFKGLLGDLFGRGLRELGKIGKIVLGEIEINLGWEGVLEDVLEVVVDYGSIILRVFL